MFDATSLYPACSLSVYQVAVGARRYGQAVNTLSEELDRFAVIARSSAFFVSFVARARGGIGRVNCFPKRSGSCVVYAMVGKTVRERERERGRERVHNRLQLSSAMYILPHWLLYIVTVTLSGLFAWNNTLRMAFIDSRGDARRGKKFLLTIGPVVLAGTGDSSDLRVC